MNECKSIQRTQAVKEHTGEIFIHSPNAPSTLYYVVNWCCSSHIMKFKNNGWSIPSHCIQKERMKMHGWWVHTFSMEILTSWISVPVFAIWLDPVSVCSIRKPVKSCKGSLCKQSPLIEMRWHLDVGMQIFLHTRLKSLLISGTNQTVGDAPMFFIHLIISYSKTKSFKLLKIWFFSLSFKYHGTMIDDALSFS